MSLATYTTRQHTSVWFLVLMNLIPVYGVLFLNWQVFDVVIIYVAESVIIGLLNIFKMAFCTVMASGEKSGGLIIHLLKIIMIPFFIFHFFFFIAMQSLFVFTILGDQKMNDFEEVPGMFTQLISADTALGASIISILASHIFSFVVNYIGNKEYSKIGLPTLMFQPYIRIFIQQFVVIFGFILMTLFNTPDVFVLLLVFLKIFVDAATHLRMHRKYGSVVVDNKTLDVRR